MDKNDDNGFENAKLDNEASGEAAKKTDVFTSDKDENPCLDGSGEAGPSTENTDVLMDNAETGGEMEVDMDDSDVESDNEDEEDEEDEEEVEEDGAEYVAQSKSDTREGSQAASASLFDAFSFMGEGTRSVEDEECVQSLNAESEHWVGRDSCNTAIVNTQKHFVCVKFPALVQNKDKALACLGGVHNVMDARKLGKIDLVFRPDDPYSKPTLGLYKKSNHLVVKCKRRRKVTSLNEPSTSTTSTKEDEMDDGYEYKVEVVGVVDGIFCFDRPVDFQYLPVLKKPEGGYRELLSDLIIKFTDDRQDFINRDVPLFLPPYIFSRSERPAKYIFQNDENTEQKHIGLSRKVRHLGTYRVTFSSKVVPDTPHPAALAIYEVSKGSLEPLRKIFRERPLWSKVAIISKLRAVRQDWLIKHLAMVAYIFYTGPWLHLWCRLGYDPRKHKEAKMYQTIDFRMRKSILLEKVTAKRSTHCSLGWQGMNTIQGHRLPPMEDLAHKNEANNTTPSSEQQTPDLDPYYQFSPTKIPPYRQMYYQVCDVMLEEIQKLAHQNDGQETECTEKDGWCIPDFLSMSRDILAKHSQNLLWKSAINEAKSAEEKGGEEVYMT